MKMKLGIGRHRFIWAALWLLPWCASALPGQPASQPLPSLRDGTRVSGPGNFHHQGTLNVAGAVVLQNMTLELSGPIVVAAGARLELDHVQLIISDAPDAPNGTSGLKCLGAASITIRHSAMKPVGSAHPMWMIEGRLDVDGFDTLNSEFHLQHTDASVKHLKIFEFEASHGSRVTADDLDLVFLSSHTNSSEAVRFSGIPSDKSFSRRMRLGSGATADLTNTRASIFLIYVEGQSKVEMADMGRVQIGLFTTCHGSLTLPGGRLGTSAAPSNFPDAGTSDCPFRLSLNNVNVDSWDLYTSGDANLRLTDSIVDELSASDHARIDVSKSTLFADWLAVSDEASLSVSDSTVGALRLAAQRPDLATSQIRLSGQSRATFVRDRFDCGLYASDEAHATLSAPVAPPRYIRQIGAAHVIEAARSDPENRPHN